MTRRALRRVAFVVITLGVVEIACRLVLPAPGFVPHSPVHIEGLHVPHPARGFSYAPHVRGRRTTSDYDTPVVINALGLRDDPVDLTAREPRLLVVGDSYTEGLGVQQWESWPEQLERTLKVSVVNAGVVGYGLPQMRMLVEELLPSLQPHVVLVGLYSRGLDRLADPYVYFSGDIVRRSALPKLAAAAGGYRHSVFAQPWAVRADLWLGRYFWFAGHLVTQAQAGRERLVARPAAPQPDVTRPLPRGAPEELDRLRAITHAAGVPLVIVMVSGQQPDGTFRRSDLGGHEAVALHAAARGIVVVDPTLALIRAAAGRPILRFQSDTHWTALAHRVAAGEVADRLTRGGARLR